MTHETHTMTHEVDATIKVLLVEREPNDYVLVQNLLSRTRGATCEIRWVKEPAEAEGAITDADYDVCLIDDRFGKDSSIGLVGQVHNGHRSVPCIMLASQDEYRRDLAAMEAGAVDYLVKEQLSANLLERAIRYAIERKRVETVQLRRAATLHSALAAAIANLSVAVLISDPNLPDNPLVFANPAFSAITGYAPEDVIGSNFPFLKHIDTDPETVAEIRGAIQERRLYKGTILNRRKDGTGFRNSLVICPVFNENGALTNFVGLSEDVTAQGQSQEALYESQRRFDAMVAIVPGMVYQAEVGRDGKRTFLYASDGARDLFGISPEELLSHPFPLARFVHPSDRDRYLETSDLAIKNVSPWRWQARFVLASGAQKTIQCCARPQAQIDGSIRWDGLCLDVTEQVRAERVAANLAAIVEGSDDAITSKTLDGTVTSWNGAAERFYGYTSEEMIGQPLALLVPRDRPNEVTELLVRLANGERIKSYETVRRAKDGSLVDVSLTLSPVKDVTGKIIGASTIAHDIREHKRAQARIEQQIARIQALRNIDMAIAASLDLRVTLNVLLDQVTSHLHVDSAAVLLVNAHTQRLEYGAGRGFRGNDHKRTTCRFGHGYAGRAALEQQIINIPDLSAPDVSFKRAPLIVGEDFVSYWAVPLICKGRVEGVLEIYHRSYLDGGSEWLDFLETLAGQAAIAIENAGLFNELQRSNAGLQVAYDSTLEGWSKALDLRDKETEGHTLRVTEATITLGRAMDISGNELTQMRRGALLHDIGKMGIPDSILLKPGALTPEEWVIMKMHPVYAFELLSPISYLRQALEIPYCHHEKWDGSGYPRGLKGEQIPLSARVFAVVDVWDALSSDRPYRAAWTSGRVREHIAQGSGSHFDPQVVDVFLKSGSFV